MAIRTYIYADCLADLIVVHPFSVSYNGTACSLLQPLSLRLPLFLPDGGAKWRDCIMVSLTVHGRSLTAYPFTYPCPSSAAAALLARLHPPRFQGLAEVLSFSFPCGQVCLPIPVAVPASWSWFHPFSYPSLQIIHGVLFIFQISPTSIFLCKVSASGVPQGSPSGTCLVIFSSFWGAVAPDPKTL